MAERELPFDIDMEQALLGAIMVNEKLYWAIAEDAALIHTDFYDPLHQRLFAKFEKITATGAVASPLTLHAAMGDDPGLKEVGGLNYLKSLALGAPAFANVRDYANVLRTLAIRRRLIELGQALVEGAYSKDEDPVVLSDVVSENLYDTTHGDREDEGPRNLHISASRAVIRIDQAIKDPHSARILTGLPTIDKELGGLFQRSMTVLGAASSQGKSGLAAQIAIEVARAGHGVVHNSIEEGEEEFALRYIAQDVNVTARRMAEGNVSDEQFGRIALVPETYMDLPFLLDPHSSPTVAQIRSRANAARRKMGKLSLVVVDHLRLVKPADSRAPLIEAVDQVTRDLKRLAKDLDVSVLLVSQFNRDFWKRAGHRPIISDLYGGGSIEQNADHIWFLHREEYYLTREEPKGESKEHDEWEMALQAVKGKAEVFSVKRRGGPTGKVILNFDAPMMRFIDPSHAKYKTSPSFFDQAPSPEDFT